MQNPRKNKKSFRNSEVGKSVDNGETEDTTSNKRASVGMATKFTVGSTFLKNSQIEEGIDTTLVSRENLKDSKTSSKQ